MKRAPAPRIHRREAAKTGTPTAAKVSAAVGASPAAPAPASSPAMAHLLSTLPELHRRQDAREALERDYNALLEKARLSINEANARVVAAARAAGVRCWRVGERVYSLGFDDEGFSLSNDGWVTFTDCQAVAPGGDQ